MTNKNKILIAFSVLLLIVTPVVTVEIPQVAYAHESVIATNAMLALANTTIKPTPKPVAVAKPVVKKKVVAKKKVVKKRKEKLTITPPLFTPDTAPHTGR